ncbi:MAG: hypothetical protein K0S45_482 [Nitrospira sp.]|jgi:hypothetical protein|nr:hypothetical protein [Nitrospira sp.]
MAPNEADAGSNAVSLTMAVSKFWQAPFRSEQPRLCRFAMFHVPGLRRSSHLECGILPSNGFGG